MPSTLDPDDDAITAKTDLLQPKHADGTVILWGGNPAHAEGVLFEVGKYYERVGLFQELIKNRSVLLSNGKTAVEHLQAISFVSGIITDCPMHDFENPCPPTPARITAYNLTRTAAGLVTFKTIDKVPEHVNAIVSVGTVNAELSKMHRSLMFVIEDPDLAEEMADEAKGDGLKLHGLIAACANDATNVDRALVRSTLNNFISKGMSVAINTKSITSHVRTLLQLNRHLPPKSRKSDEDLTGILQGVIYKDAELRKTFDLTCIVKDPGTDFSVNLKLIKSILRKEEVSAQIDEGGATALISLRPNAGRDASAIAALSAEITEFRALIAAGDPYKGGDGGGRGRGKGNKGKGGEKGKAKGEGRGRGRNGGRETSEIDIPRDKDNRIIKWVEGMPLCVCGSKHLYRECDEAKKKAAAALLAAGTDSTKKANLVEMAPGAANFTDDQLAAFFDQEQRAMASMSVGDIKQTFVVTHSAPEMNIANDSLLLGAASAAVAPADLTGANGASPTLASENPKGFECLVSTQKVRGQSAEGPPDEPEGEARDTGPSSAASTAQRSATPPESAAETVASVDVDTRRTSCTISSERAALAEERNALALQVQALNRADEHDGDTEGDEPCVKCYVYDTTYAVGEKLTFYSANVGPWKGVHFGAWRDVSPSVLGEPAPAGVTASKSFVLETDALTHCRSFGVHLPGYELSLNLKSGRSPPPPPAADAVSAPTGIPASAHAPALAATEAEAETAASAAIDAAEGKTSDNSIEIAALKRAVAAHTARTAAADTLAQPAPAQPPQLPSTYDRLSDAGSRFWLAHGFTLFAVLVAVVATVCAMSLVMAPPPLHAHGHRALSVLRLGGAMDGEPHHENQGMLITRVARAREITGWLKWLRPWLALRIFVTAAMLYSFVAPAGFWWEVLNSPRDFWRVAKYALTLPLMAIVPSIATPTLSSVRATAGAIHRIRRRTSRTTLCRSFATAVLIMSAMLLGARVAKPPGHSNAPGPSLLAPPTVEAAPVTFTASRDVRNVDLPYQGMWMPALPSSIHSAQGFAVDGTNVLTALVNDTFLTNSVTGTSGLPEVHCTPDSGCTASCTDDCRRLINTSPCDEIFGQANGHITRATMIGDMPVLSKAFHPNGTSSLVRFAFTNVRCVPEFKYTLLSVKQIWKEQGIDARFADFNHLALPKSSGSLTIPFDKKKELSTLVFVSDPMFKQGKQGGPRAEVLQCATSRKRVSSALVGFHSPKSGATFIGKLSPHQAAEMMHRRTHLGHVKTRRLPQNSDAPTNLTNAPPVTCVHCTAGGMKNESHSGTMEAGESSPGILNFDMKGPFPPSVQGYKYFCVYVDSYTRFIFVQFIKSKSEVVECTKRACAEFAATVGSPVDGDGHVMAKPIVREIRRDHEGGLESRGFQAFKDASTIHDSSSPPYDHDTNGISERAIALLDANATASAQLAFGTDGKPPIGFWPYFVRNAVHVHNATNCAVGSSGVDSQISCFQRFTLRKPKIMDLCAIGCRCVVLKPPQNQSKGTLSARGWVGSFLGRSTTSVGAWEAWIHSEKKVVCSSSFMCDEEYYPWRGADAYQPLTPTTKQLEQSQPAAAGRAANAAGSPSPPTSATANATDVPVTASPANANLNARPRAPSRFLNLFSGKFDRSRGMSEQLKSRGWSQVDEVDNSPVAGGGWLTDLLNDELYTTLVSNAKAGLYDAIHVAFPCSTFSIARMFQTEGEDPGPPPVRNFLHPDGLPKGVIDPAHAKELRIANLLLDRAVEILIAACRSAANTTICVENPADRSIVGSNQYSADTSDHGSLFRTSAMKRLALAVGPLETCTYAGCMLGGAAQKYTTLVYTPDAATVLNELSGPKFQCNHEPNTHEKIAGGRIPNSKRFASEEAAAYAPATCAKLADAFTFARTGSYSMRDVSGTVADEPCPKITVSAAPVTVDRRVVVEPDAFQDKYQHAVTQHPARETQSPLHPSPVSFQGFESQAARPAAPGPQGMSTRAVRSSTRSGTDASGALEQTRQEQAAARRASSKMSTVPESPPAPYTTFTGTPVHADDEAENATAAVAANAAPLPADSAAAVAEAAVSELIFEVHRHVAAESEYEFMPGSKWVDVDESAVPASAARIDHQTFIVDASDAPSMHKHMHRALRAERTALRADSAGAPETQPEAMKRGGLWPASIDKEMTNHYNNESWTEMPVSKLPKGRRLHKFVWVFKIKRSGECKSRLAVQGCTFQAGADFDQVRSTTMRYGSARSLFAYAARHRCGVRSHDLVAAYLQGEFIDGEVCYCYMPVGFERVDPNTGEMMICRIDKPVYGIPQAGRRLQRKLMPYLNELGLVQLDDSDECVLVAPASLAGDEIFAVGLYVDNLQVVHSAKLDDDGVALDKTSIYHKVMSKLHKDWDVVDEGPMVDLLGIQARFNQDGSVTLHQEEYIDKMTERFYPDGIPPKVKNTCLPFSGSLRENVIAALTNEGRREDGSPVHPHLVKEFQQKCGCLMYSSTACRPDVSYPVHTLCRAMACPTPALMLELDYVFGYLAKHRSTGITYDAGPSELAGCSDASFDTYKSTSGWSIQWQNATVSWGSRRQPCVALSSMEAELVALSEAAKDMVYYRKLIRGIDPDAVEGPTNLSTDNKAARDTSYNPDRHDKTKHIERRHFFIRDMVESFELRVPFVRTDDNYADFLTKPLDKKKFQHFRAILMNETPVARASAALAHALHASVALHSSAR